MQKDDKATTRGTEEGRMYLTSIIGCPNGGMKLKLTEFYTQLKDCACPQCNDHIPLKPKTVGQDYRMVIDREKTNNQPLK